ncbi:unnamed protein product, partial [Dicrocoelium dendriticum]
MFRVKPYHVFVTRLRFSRIFLRTSTRAYSIEVAERGVPESPKWVNICGQLYPCDSWFNVPPRIIELTTRSLHNQQHHPLCLIKQRIIDFMAKRHSRRNTATASGTPLFSVHDRISPVVTTRQNFDSLL